MNLSFLGPLSQTDGNEEEVLGEDIKEEQDDKDSEELIIEVQRLLVKIQKSKAVSAEGTSAFLSLVALLSSITETHADALISKFKSKKVFKHLVDAAAGSGNIHLHRSLFKVLSKLKSKELSGKPS